MDDEDQKEFKELLSRYSLQEIEYIAENFKHITNYESLLILLRHPAHKI